MPPESDHDRGDGPERALGPGEYRYPYLISVRGSRPVPARRDGHNFVCAYQVFLGMWWSPREVEVLEHDPNMDYFAELRQQIRERARQNERSENAWERVDEQSPRRPEPPTPPAAESPSPSWGR